MSTRLRTLRLGTRASALARWQTDWVRARLLEAWPGLACQVTTLTTTGDRILDRPLPEIGGKGLFTQELEAALRAGEIDLAVHSLKDLPVDDAPGLVLGAISQRADARDVLISAAGYRFADLPAGARVGTSSLRRSAQLLAARSDLALQPLRGNVDTRVRKALSGEYDAIVLAAAGVLRLGLDAHVGEFLSFDVMLPAPGQGALAVQCRAGDAEVIERLQPLDHTPTRAAVAAERAFLSGLGGGCAVPVAAYAVSREDGSVALTGLVAAPDGAQVIRVEAAGRDPLVLGRDLARLALAEGAGALLA
jgi:hydroxymethylbilane synthase